MASHGNESEATSPIPEDGLDFEVAPGLDAMAERDNIEDLSLAHQEAPSRAEYESDEVEDQAPPTKVVQDEEDAELIKQHSDNDDEEATEVDEATEVEEEQDQFNEGLLFDLKQQAYLKRKSLLPSINSFQIVENNKSDQKGGLDDTLLHSSSSSSNSNDLVHDGGESDIVFSESRCSTTVTRVRADITSLS